MKIKNQKGIGLVEVVAALGISVVVITALVSLTVFTLRSSQRSKALLEASKQANRTLELVRALRESSTAWYVDGTDVNAFVDVLALNNCDTAYCDINESLTVSSHVKPATAADLTADQVDVYFTAQNPDGSELDINTDVVRISVYSVTRLGDDLKQTTLYTDLTNWLRKPEPNN